MARKPAGSGIASRSRKAVDRLSPKKREYLAVRMNNGTIAQAAESAGVSKRQGSNYEKAEDVQIAYRELIRAALPQEEIVNLIVGGAHATTPVYGPDGRKKKDRPDWKTRRPFIEMAREDAGYVAQKDSSGGAVVISVEVNHIGQPANQLNGEDRTKPTIIATT